MPSSRMTNKYQTTIPRAVRERLSLGADDRLEFRIVRGRVVLEKALPHDPEYLKALEKTLAPEWSSKADTEAYRRL